MEGGGWEGRERFLFFQTYFKPQENPTVIRTSVNTVDSSENCSCSSIYTSEASLHGHVTCCIFLLVSGGFRWFVASASSLGAARFNFTGVVPTGDKGGDFTGPEGLFLCVKSWFCLVSLLLCSILLFVGKLENKTRGDTPEEEFGNFRKASRVEPVWAGGLSRSSAPFSVFFTLMLVLVELPSNTMRGLFLSPSAAVLLLVSIFTSFCSLLFSIIFPHLFFGKSLWGNGMACWT